jgi:MPBQ/MSBQ methyltransferase
MQHKREAYWFYRFLSIFYDKLVNPLFWTEDMRDQALSIGELDEEGISVIDVGSGTGFTTEGIVQYVPAKNVKCVDQSPHQMAKAKRKPALAACTFELGDAENIPAETDQFDRYVSAGSIEYWPEPQKGITEAYRVIKPGGKALMIGPLEPENPIGKWIANTWMLFPKEEEYIQWYKNAGFTDIKKVYFRPHWVRKDRYGIALLGTKPTAGPSPYTPPAKPPKTDTADLLTPWRVLLGSIAGFLFIPIALLGYLYAAISPARKGETHSLNAYQWGMVILFILLIFWLVSIIL